MNSLDLYLAALVNPCFPALNWQGPFPFRLVTNHWELWEWLTDWQTRQWMYMGPIKYNIVFWKNMSRNFKSWGDFESAFWCAKGDYSVRRGNRSLLSDGTEAEGSLHAHDEKGKSQIQWVGNRCNSWKRARCILASQKKSSDLVSTFLDRVRIY